MEQEERSGQDDVADPLGPDRQAEADEDRIMRATLYARLPGRVVRWTSHSSI